MGKLKVVYAPPGTDPTRLPSDPPNLSIWGKLRDNWLLLAGLAAMILFAPRVLGIGGGEEETLEEARPAPTAVAAPGDDLAGWCDYHGQLAPPGEYHIGDKIRECRGGAWYAVDEVGTAEQLGTVSAPGTVEQ